MESTAASTVVPSKAPSVTEHHREQSEKTLSRTPSAEPLPKAEIDNASSTPGSISNHESASGEPEIEYPSALKLVTILVALSLAVLCVALDNTIIATAIPRITDEFQALDSVGWLGSAYLLTTCALQLFFGRLYTLFNIKWTFLVALLWFEVGSVICGAAPNAEALIVGRAIAGIGSAGLFSGALIILAHSTPLEKRPMYTGLIASMYGIASVIGPLLGGAFTDNVSWRWCFYINLPLGAITAVIIMIFFKSPQQAKQVSIGWKARIMKFDPFGTPLFLAMIICLLLALQWGGTSYAWSDGRIIALLTVFAVLVFVFIGIQVWAGEDATVPLRIAKQRTVASASLYALCLGASFFIFMYYLPLWFQAVRGDSAVRSGINNLPMMLGTVISSVACGAAVTIFGYYAPFFYVAVVFGSIGAGLLTTLEPGISTGRWIGYQILYGVGIGAGLQQALVAVQTVLPLADIPIGTSIVVFSQMLGGALFISVGQNIFSNELMEGLSGIQGLNIDPTIVVHTGATQLTSVVTDPGMLQTVISAYNDALTSVYQIGLIMIALAALGAVGIQWVSVKGKKIEAIAA